jgi:hypothetical protein
MRVLATLFFTQLVLLGKTSHSLLVLEWLGAKFN